MRTIATVMALIAGMAGCLAATASGAAERVDDRCQEDDLALEGWYVDDSRSDGSYLILQKKLRHGTRFYLCRIDGEARRFVRELGIEADSSTTHIEAARCTPFDSGVPGSGYLSVLDNRTARLLALYRFDALAEDVEKMAPGTAVCSAAPAG
jgi:hypothetical protein